MAYNRRAHLLPALVPLGRVGQWTYTIAAVQPRIDRTPELTVHWEGGGGGVMAVPAPPWGEPVGATYAELMFTDTGFDDAGYLPMFDDGALVGLFIPGRFGLSTVLGLRVLTVGPVRNNRLPRQVRLAAVDPISLVYGPPFPLPGRPVSMFAADEANSVLVERDLWCEVEDDASAIDIQIDDESAPQPSTRSLTLAMRYDPSIVPNHRIRVDGSDYTVRDVSYPDRRRTMRLGLQTPAAPL